MVVERITHDNKKWEHCWARESLIILNVVIAIVNHTGQYLAILTKIYWSCNRTKNGENSAIQWCDLAKNTKKLRKHNFVLKIMSPWMLREIPVTSPCCLTKKRYLVINQLLCCVKVPPSNEFVNLYSRVYEIRGFTKFLLESVLLTTQLRWNGSNLD